MDSVTAYLAGLPEPLREVGEKLRTVIDAGLPTATAAVWHGHPVWGTGDRPGQAPICLLKAYAGYVTFGLWRGQDIVDGTGRLAPGARRMASVRLRTLDEIDPVLFTGWLRAADGLADR
ncbi:DUF1801 domain-containing protein [Micromonospora sp. HK10]|uniref:DUF1801 domain-containing protein n=1 Tax=Micromonospora sp. HK10 TaxID=1538294 RepID=UPI0006273043|nr:DUF1801 domain-containing protein [Micromonospora sp. HK10]KKJ99592.1 hypothetical protein LQ51_22575 [Micromonospora sp. HK10]